MLRAEFRNQDTYLHGGGCFGLAETLDCGQAFRWRTDDGILWHGIAGNRPLTLRSIADGAVLENVNETEYNAFWRNYFDADRDYAAVCNALGQNEILGRAARFGRGIRLLRQDPWETLCSFIISSNNNIPRIKGIIDRLCTAFGEPVGTEYGFPTAERLAGCVPDDLAVLRSGFRAKYIADAAQKVAEGTVRLEALYDADYADAKAELMRIKGVGPKVADCVLLFGLGHIEAFPRDVWINRTMTELFDGELPACAVPYAGIAQQYLFYYARENNLKEQVNERTEKTVNLR